MPLCCAFNNQCPKIIQEVGLCICFWDLLKASDGLIGHGEGKVHVKGLQTPPDVKIIDGRLTTYPATFRLVVFRPFKGEILEGKITSATPKGMTITMEFFDDIFIPCPLNIFEHSHL